MCTSFFSGKPARILVNGGATPSFINRKCASSLSAKPLSGSFAIALGDSSTITGKNWFNQINPDINWPNNIVRFKHCKWTGDNLPALKSPLVQGSYSPDFMRSTQSKILPRSAFPSPSASSSAPAPSPSSTSNKIVHKNKSSTQVLLCYLRSVPLEDQIEANNLQGKNLCAIASSNGKDKAIRKKLAKEHQEIVNTYPKRFQKFKNLPPLRPTDHAILLQPVSIPPKPKSTYPMSEHELKVLREELDLLINNG
ncbi:hypothetical protein HK100_006479 [Physocladia obscura]|uniref:Uncharacterized protein n=1 Tax=Physocladia obscura TaxID=109957 RepID=A0AAD5T619_9FUNG|nr:hypothetical protein HK100_006479 [Physocladia obscura]